MDAGIEPVTYFDFGGHDHRPHPHRPLAGGARPVAGQRRGGGPRRPAGAHGAAASAATRRRTCPSSRSGPATCCASGPARRCPSTGSSRAAARRSTNRCSPGSRCPCRKAEGDPVIGATPQRQRLVPHARHARRPRHRARPDRAHGPRGAGLQGAHPAHRRPRHRVVRAPRHRPRGAHVRCLVAPGPRACPDVRPRLGHHRAHHRLPLRHGPGDAHRRHGGDRPRSGARHAHPWWRGPRAGRARGHGHLRQDRHAHDGPPGGHPR